MRTAHLGCFPSGKVKKRKPTWLTIDLLVILVSLVIIGVGSSG